MSGILRRWDTIPLNKNQLIEGIKTKSYRHFWSPFHVLFLLLCHIESHQLRYVDPENRKEGISSISSASNGAVATVS